MPGPAPGATGNKAAFFEQAAKEGQSFSVSHLTRHTANPAPKVKKSWNVTGHSGGNANEGKYKQKTTFSEAPPGSGGKAEQEQDVLRINIKTMNSNLRPFPIDAGPEQTVTQLKSIIASKMNIPVSSQRLIYQGKVMKDEQQLKTYGIKNENTIHLVSSKPEVTANSTNLTSSNGVDQMQTENADSGETEAPTISSVQNHSIRSTEPQRTTTNVDGFTHLRSQISVLRSSIATLPTWAFPRDSPGTLSEFPMSSTTSSVDSLGQCMSQLSTSVNRLLPVLSTLSHELMEDGRAGSFNDNNSQPRTSQERLRTQQLATQLSPVMEQLGHLFLSFSESLYTLRMGENPGSSHVSPPTRSTQNARPTVPGGRTSGNENLLSTLSAVMNGGNGPAELSGLFANLSQAITGEQMSGFPAIFSGIGSESQMSTADTSLINSARSSAGVLMSQTFNTVNQAMQESRNTPANQIIQSIARGLSDRDPPAVAETTTERFVNQILQVITLPEIVQVMGGQWGPVQRIQPQICDYVKRELLKNDTSERAIEALSDDINGTFFEIFDPQNLSPALRQKLRSSYDLQQIVSHVTKKRIVMLLNIIIADYTAAPSPFVTVLRNWCKDSTNETVRVMSQSFVGGVADASSALRELLQERLDFLSPEFAVMATNMITSYVMQNWSSTRQPQDNDPSTWEDAMMVDEIRQTNIKPKGNSDSYLTGAASNKKRKVAPTKSTTPAAVLTDRMREAVAAANVKPKPSIDIKEEQISEAIAKQDGLGRKYNEQLKEDVKKRLEEDSDYNPTRLPASQKTFNPKK
ncbi:ubiquilin-1-like isoform 1 [Planoprotostelium fungivorum]|uniref:Ubiquilin-1-like isoform 1 n=1 Tax=Planoprotostelium fungivorum TaxID=1890364 RepID=A0A2P6NMG3_9EUKA|nr:ubiquilin-1-like isoform 1 [Planoprotostelium fungivorum]